MSGDRPPEQSQPDPGLPYLPPRQPVRAKPKFTLPPVTYAQLMAETQPTPAKPKRRVRRVFRRKGPRPL